MTSPADPPPEGDVIFDQTPTGSVRVEVLFLADTFWLNQKRIADLFGVDRTAASQWQKETYVSGNRLGTTVRKNWIVQLLSSRTFPARRHRST
jgi:hypothetical protein